MNFRIKHLAPSLLFYGLCFPALAHQHETCHDLNGNSCWHISNESEHVISISCNNSFKRSDLRQAQSFSYQFCSGESDGLGYSGPGANYSCDLVVDGKPTSKVNFSSINYGDRVRFKILPDKLIVTILEFWGTRVKAHEQKL